MLTGKDPNSLVNLCRAAGLAGESCLCHWRGPLCYGERSRVSIRIRHRQVKVRETEVRLSVSVDEVNLCALESKAKVISIGVFRRMFPFFSELRFEGYPTP